MLSPYGMEIVESCLTCKLRAERIFCDLPANALQAFENIKYAAAYPQGAVLFVEGQTPCGVFILCKGRVKMSACAGGGKVLIVRIAEPGEVLGAWLAVGEVRHDERKRLRCYSCVARIVPSRDRPANLCRV